MSTTDYLSSLDLDQLRFAREEADRRIKAIEDEEKATIWIVQGPNINEACFRENEFQQAKEKLAELILSDRFGISDVRHDHPRIIRLKVPESEADEYMELNQ